MSAVSVLDAQTVRAAAEALSGASGFWFTRRCLMFELCRRGAWPDPDVDLDACERDFALALANLEREVGRASGGLARLVRPEEAIPGVGPADLDTFDLPADLFDYSIARVALIERMDLCLMLIANGLHREIEVALTVPPAFPTHVWGRIHAQLDAGLRTTFLAIHDYGGSSTAWLAAIDEQLGEHEAAQVAPTGLTISWSSRLGIPLRGPARTNSYALLEELPPLQLMRWIYERVARGAEDVGFG
jgi:hypothetical protein